MKSKVDIILPVYREQDNIEKVLDGIQKYVKTPYRVLLVFYDKNDPTIPVVEKAKKRYKNLVLLVNFGKKGLVNQYKIGFRHCISPIILIMMSDLSDNPKDIEKLIGGIDKGADFMCASRYIKNGARIGGSKLKASLSYFGCWSLLMLTGIHTHDATNAYKAFKRELLEEIKIESRVGYEMPLELIVKAHSLGYKISEIATTWKERETGFSKFKLFSYIPNYLHWYWFAVKTNAFTKIQKFFSS